MDRLLNALKAQGADAGPGRRRAPLRHRHLRRPGDRHRPRHPAARGRAHRLAAAAHPLGRQWLGPGLPALARRPGPRPAAGRRRRARPDRRRELVRADHAAGRAVRRVLARPQIRQLPQAAERRDDPGQRGPPRRGRRLRPARPDERLRDHYNPTSIRPIQPAPACRTDRLRSTSCRTSPTSGATTSPGPPPGTSRPPTRPRSPSSASCAAS